MRLSKLLCDRTKETPSDAFMKSHILLLRAGYIKQVANGIYTLSTLGQRTSLNIENIIRQEMNNLDGQEVKFPVVMPKELWDMSGRYQSIGSEMVRFTDRVGRALLLGMTHEEAAVHLAKNWANSHNQLPFMIYQIQTKFRDEPRSRGGLIRVREFTMKDAYSFHMSQEDLENYYNKMHDAYERIYRKIGLRDNFISVKSDSGMFGGNLSHEFMFINDNGEDELIICNHCGYKANQEVAECYIDENNDEKSEPLNEVYTASAKEIDEVSKYLNIDKKHIVKAVVFAIKGKSIESVLCFTRGDREINETKLRKLCGEEVVPYDAGEDSKFCCGNIGPMNLNIDKCKVFYDLSIKNIKNACIGANKANYHITGFDINRDMSSVEYHDISKVNNGDLCPKCHEKLTLTHGIEIGNIFQLGTKYTKSMGMQVTNEVGEGVFPIMGCYGIGIGRNMACIVENNNDEKGIIMPMSVAPFKVHITPLRYDDDKVKAISCSLYEELNKCGVDCLIDDRMVSNGIKFSDADLMGMPLRVVISPKSIENGEIELKIRRTGEMVMYKIDDAVRMIKKLIDSEMEQYK